MVGYVLIVIGIVVCAIQAIRAARLLISALWLAGTSALTALLLYLLGAAEVAVIELSVGAGLVTVLFVFAINIAGEEHLSLNSVVPKPLAGILLLLVLGLLAWLVFPGLTRTEISSQVAGFSLAFWNYRQLDVLLQVALIFAGVLGVLGLLAAEEKHESRGGEE